MVAIDNDPNNPLRLSGEGTIHVAPLNGRCAATEASIRV